MTTPPTPPGANRATPLRGEGTDLDPAGRGLGRSTPPTMRLRVHGDVAWLRTWTVDDRRIEAVQTPTVPVPLLAVDGPGLGHEGAELVGRLDEVTLAGDVLSVVGVTELPPGSYPCGVDLADVEVLTQGEQLVIASGRLIGVTAYLGDQGARMPSFPRARLIVEEGAL